MGDELQSITTVFTSSNLSINQLCEKTASITHDFSDQYRIVLSLSLVAFGILTHLIVLVGKLFAKPIQTSPLPLFSPSQDFIVPVFKFTFSVWNIMVVFSSNHKM